MIDVKLEYRKALHCIGSGDKVIPYRSINDMRYGTLTIEEYDDHTLVLGQNKNNGGNLIKFAKIIPCNKRIENGIIASLQILSVGILANFLFGMTVMYEILTRALL